MTTVGRAGVIDGRDGAIAFARGGIVALATVYLVPVAIAALGARVHDVPVVAALRYLGLTGGFAAGGALGVAPLSGDRRAIAGSAAAFAVAGIIATWALEMLQGLTGRERAGTVLLFAVLSLAIAFAVAGGASAACLRAGAPGAARVGVASGAGGAVGGMFLVLPFLLSKVGLRLASGSDAQLLVDLSALTLGLLGPWVVAGAALGRRLEGAEGEGPDRKQEGIIRQP